MNMPLGMMLLMAAAVLIYFGIAHRVLDRLRLTDKQALLFIGAVIVGSFIDIPVMSRPAEITINAGGALLPAAAAIWLTATADENAERVRGVAASLLVAAVISLGSRFLPYEPENMFLDPKLLYGAAAGLIAYLIGRSRRGAFVGAVLGIVLSDLLHAATVIGQGVAAATDIGGAGAFDVIMIAAVVAVMTAEVVGESREKLQGGPVPGGNYPEGLYEFGQDASLPDAKERKTSDKSTADTTLPRGDRHE